MNNTITYKLNLVGVNISKYKQHPVVTISYDETTAPIGVAEIKPDYKTVVVTYNPDGPGHAILTGNRDDHDLGTTIAKYDNKPDELMGLSVIPVIDMDARAAAKPRKRRTPAKGKRADGTKKTTDLPSYGVTGSPSKLTPELLKGTMEYYHKKKTATEIPFVEELAIEVLDVDRHTVSRWHDKAEDKEWLAKQPTEKAELYAKFSAIVKKLATMQLMQLKKKGFESGHNTVAIFLMKADHGMIETTRTELGGIGGRPIEMKAVEVLSTKGRTGKK